MTISALIMAGGKGTRMNSPQEKPLIKICNKPVIEYVFNALKNTKNINDIYIAVTHQTPKTTKYIEKFQTKTVITPGKDYVSDMGYATQTLKLGKFLAIAADLPLITGEILDQIINRYENCGKPALTVAIPIETKIKMGMSIEYSFKMDDKDVVPTGINVIDGNKQYGNEWLDQDIYLLDKPELAINVNTPQELQIAKNILTKHPKQTT
ncbi:MAG: NTP transferase domain-containing protein [Candidatus Bathyarchaeota archaeon]|nr:NTP transferase domain-containing protein [Candidatus Termiticorpusculum sp.]MCL2868679.1 NTP transferase domain-containing protein [Candidatus Termiticorpusculum sp.]